MFTIYLNSLPHADEVPYPDIITSPTFCSTCVNLHTPSAYAYAPHPLIWIEYPPPEVCNRMADELSCPRPSRDCVKIVPNHMQRWEIDIQLIQLERSASSSGCVTCRLLKEILIASRDSSFDFNDAGLYIRAQCCEFTVLPITLMREDADKPEQLYRVPETPIYEVYTLKGDLSPWINIGFHSHATEPHDAHISSEPAHDERFYSRLRRWMSHCAEKHTVCIQAEESNLSPCLPEQVICIGPPSNKEIRLIEDGTKVQGSYIALSHWRGTGQLMCPPEDADVVQNSGYLAYDRLRQTFQDAITVCRGLGIQYLWIDAVCIPAKQDIDLEVESEKVASIYSNAKLVLAATDLTGQNTGFLRPRVPSIKIPVNYCSHRTAVFARPVLSHSAFYSEPYHIRWFQEQGLALRILHFTETEVVFGCLSHHICECGGLRDHGKDPRPSFRRMLREISAGKTHYQQLVAKPLAQENIIERSGLPTEEFMSYHEHWRLWLVQLSMVQLGDKASRYYALGSLASRWANGHAGRYLGGFWEHDFLNYLLWRTIPSGDHQKLDGAAKERQNDGEDEYTGPSWSCVSACREVAWDPHLWFRNAKSFIQIDFSRSQCDVTSTGPYGPVQSGHIFLTGKILKIRNFSWRKDEKRTHGVQLDHPFSLADYRTQEIFCLRLCNKSYTFNTYNDDFALILKKAGEGDLARQSMEVRQSEHVYFRIGITDSYTHKTLKHEEESIEVEMYLI